MVWGWVPASSFCSAGTCTFEPNIPLSSGNYAWSISPKDALQSDTVTFILN